MTFLQRLQSHKGGLIRLKTELWWYNVGDWDNNPGRVCLVLDAVVGATAATDAATAATDTPHVVTVDALLLIDGSPQWVWFTEEDVEVI